MDVELTIVWQIIVYNQRDLLNVQSSSPNISGDQHTTATEQNCHIMKYTFRKNPSTVDVNNYKMKK